VIEVPGGSADVRVEPGIVTARGSAGGKTTVEVTFEPGTQTRVSWATHEAAPVQAERESRFLADVRTLATIGEAEFRVTVLVDLQVVQGDPKRFELRLPEGFEAPSVSGSSVDAIEGRPGYLTLAVRDPTERRHQVLISLERREGPTAGKLPVPLLGVEGVQREAGEVAVEGVGTLELTTSESKSLHRLDVRELHPALRALARQPLLAAFRYQRTRGEAPSLDVEASRFPDAGVLSALAERAVVTTLVTGEGRALTEVKLTVRNHAQPYLRVSLSEGTTLFSAEVAGERVKPAKGDDGTRVPLLRAGFRPTGAYEVSFVYLASGTPFAKKGEAHLSLPKMDVPVSVLEWELFVPEQYNAKKFGGNALPAERVGWPPVQEVAVTSGQVGGVSYGGRVTVPPGSRTVTGRVTDEGGEALPGATVSAGGRQATTDANGAYVLTGLPFGQVRLTASLQGFTTLERDVIFRTEGVAHMDFVLKVGSVTETITVTAETPVVDRKAMAPPAPPPPPEQQNAPSANVFALQKRVAGVLPVRVEVPRKGSSLRFVRPLVLDEETTVSFQYKTR
jgi:hypothetical protein